MMEKDYKKIINVLLIINAICLIVIAALCGEIYLLQEKLSELTDTIQTLNTKISHLESIQYETMYGDRGIEKGNGYILGGVATIIGLLAIMYFGGINPGDLGKALNLLGDQSKTDLIQQNKLIDENMKLCLSSIDFMNRSILNEITSKTDYICTKLEVILNSMITKDVNLNSIFSKITSGKNDWE